MGKKGERQQVYSGVSQGLLHFFSSFFSGYPSSSLKRVFTKRGFTCKKHYIERSFKQDTVMNLAGTGHQLPTRLRSSWTFELENRVLV